jgi:uncharacterized protein YjbI with pentapeptide repeats
MANPDHLNIIRHGVDAWNTWREENYGIEPDLAEVDLHDSELKEANFSETDLRHANLRGASFRGATFIKADLRGADLQKASFNLANLSEANLSEAVLRRTDFSEATLKKAYLIRADLVGADLFEADLERADFRWAFLIGTNLRHANLTKSDFRWAYLIEADLSEADLSEANLIEANLSKADLQRVNFRNALVARSYFCDLDLSMAKGLHTILHFGPSTIGIDTIQRSKGHISESFLHGAGVPQSFINYTSSLSEKDLSDYSGFISYVDEDWDFAEKLHNDLDHNGGHCWFIPEELKIGNKIQHDMEQSIRIHDKVVLVLSQNSVSRPWMEKEVENAFEEEIKKKKTLLIPVMIDTEVMESDQNWAVELRRSRHIADFSNWSDPETYNKALERLLHILKSG